jgi:hypothetical protein
MIWALMCFVGALALIAFALRTKDCVRASVSLHPLGFFLEAKNNNESKRPK